MLIAFECCNMKKLDFYEKARCLHNKVFDDVDLENPSSKVLHLARTLGMNQDKERNARETMQHKCQVMKVRSRPKKLF